jgi:hypothetical protein
MHEYEIRVLRADRSTIAVMEVIHLNDNAAIRAADRIAGTMPFEVWRGLNCIYGGHLTEPSLRWSPTRPAA